MNEISINNHSVLTVQHLINAHNELKWPGYGKLKTEVDKIKSPIERVFRLTKFINNNSTSRDMKAAAESLLKELTNG